MLSEHDIPIAPSTYYAYRDRGFGPTEADLADAYAANELFQLWRRTGVCTGAGSCGRPPVARV